MISLREGDEPGSETLSWTVGAVTIRRPVEIELTIPYNAQTPFIAEATPAALEAMPWLVPDFVTGDGAIRLSIHSLLVQAPHL